MCSSIRVLISIKSPCLWALVRPCGPLFCLTLYSPSFVWPRSPCKNTQKVCSQQVRETSYHLLKLGIITSLHKIYYFGLTRFHLRRNRSKTGDETTDQCRWKLVWSPLFPYFSCWLLILIPSFGEKNMCPIIPTFVYPPYRFSDLFWQRKKPKKEKKRKNPSDFLLFKLVSSSTMHLTLGSYKFCPIENFPRWKIVATLL